MRPLPPWPLVAVLLLLVASSCGSSQTQAKPPVGDACLVGTWTLQHEVNLSGYGYAGVPLQVAGLDGARLTVKSNGNKKEIFDGSKPLVGTTQIGQWLVITISGSATFTVHGDGHIFSETGSTQQLPTVATIDGTPVPDYQSSYSPAHGTYTCTANVLTTTTSSEVQTDTWTKV